MFEIPHDAIVPVEKFTQYFNEDPKIYIDMNLVSREVESLRAKYKSRIEQLTQMMYSTLGWIPNELTKKVILMYLDKAGVPVEYTQKRGTGADTFDKKVKQKLIEDGYQVDFMLLHLDMSSLKYYLSKVESLLETVRNKRTVEGNEGETLTEIPYSVAATFNRRFSTSKENVIGFYGTLKSAMKAPKGYVLVSGDFPQIDGKGALYLYLKTRKMLDIASTTKDSYLVFKEMVRHVEHMKDEDALKTKLALPEYSDTTDLEKRISSFNQTVMPFTTPSQRDVYKVIALRTVYNSQSSPFRAIDRAIKRLASMLNVTSRYRAVKELAEYFHNIGYPIVARSRWGYTRPITETSKFKIFSKLFNSPVQTTSSEIIMFYSVYILDNFRSMGYTKDDIKLYLNRHDEPMFQVSIELFKKFAGFFKQISHILVHGWLPFEIDWSVGYGYKADVEEYKSLLMNTPYDDTEINRIAAEHLHDPEPITLEVPDMCALSHRVLPDGRVIFVLTRQLGDFPEDEYYFKIYKDNRPVEYAFMSVRLDSEVVSFDDLMYMIQRLLSGLPSDKQYIVLLDSEYGSRQFTLGEYSVFVSGAKHPLHELNKVIIASTVCSLFPEIATERDNYYNKFTKYYQPRLERRVIK